MMRSLSSRHGHAPLSGQATPEHAIRAVRYRDRHTGRICTERVPAEGALHWLYETALGRLCATPLFGLRLASMVIGIWQRSRWSRRHIRDFIRDFGIDEGEFAEPAASFRSFNDFFTRHLRPGFRPFHPDPAVLCAPADGKALVFPVLAPDTTFPVKGARLGAAGLLRAAADAGAFLGGSALVVRLAPSDYHRFHFCDHGTASPPVHLGGRLDSVNPIALRRKPDLLARNQRTVTSWDTRSFGACVQVEIGAFAVGSIVQSYRPGPVHRGQEKGYFQFGGSTVVLLFRPGRVVFDEDLIRDSQQDLEVAIRTGERLGRTPS